MGEQKTSQRFKCILDNIVYLESNLLLQKILFLKIVITSNYSDLFN